MHWASWQSRSQTGNILLEALIPMMKTFSACFFIETFSTLNLNISGRYYQRTQCTDEQERPRSECADAHANLQLACSAFLLSQKWSDQLRNSGTAVTRLTQIPEYYRNTGIPVKNTRIHVKTPILALIKKRIYSEDDLEKSRSQFPYSPKLVSFPCSLRRLIWVYPVA